MALSHTFELTLLDTGRKVNVFDKYDIALDMMKPGSPWTFSLWRSSNADTRIDVAKRQTAWSELLSDVKLGGQILFSIDGAPQLNGVIETFNVTADRHGGACMVISGRDLSAAALDWDADPRVNLRNVPLDQCLQNLFNRVGIQAIIGASADADRLVRTRQRPGARGTSSTAKPRKNKVDLSHAKPGERVWQVAESIVKKLGYMMWVAPCTDGLNQMAVVVDVPNYTQPSTYHFIRQENLGEVAPYSEVLQSSFAMTIRDVPTYIYAAGHTARGDTQASRVRVPMQNTVLTNGQNGRPWAFLANPLPPHPRWINTKRARTPKGAQQEAARLMADSTRDFRTYTCTVQGHGQVINGRMQLFAINTMAKVFDSLGGYTFLNEDMLIHRVEFSGSRQGGQTTKLTLGTSGAIVLTPETT